MKFMHNNLSVLSYANNFTLWHYKAGTVDVETEGFFNDARALLRTGDLILACGFTNEDVPTTKNYTVMNKGGVVTLL